jgi:hypothetical protein
MNDFLQIQYNTLISNAILRICRIVRSWQAINKETNYGNI